MNRTFVHNVLSVMTITRVGLANHSGRQTGGRGHTRSGQRPDERVRDFYRKYAGCGGIMSGGGLLLPGFLGKMIKLDAIH